ncbi:MAG: hypothetical protein WCR72_18550 [Bacteroidota bacterium]
MSNNSTSRLFNMSDADLLQAGEIIAATLPEDIESFTAFDSTLISDLPTEIKHAILQAKAIHADDVVVQEQADLTETLNEAHSNCITAYQGIAYFVRKAYPDSPAMQKKFGLAEYKNVVNNKNKFIRFMEELAATAKENKEALIKSGCSADLISSLPVLATTLLEADRAQEKFKKQRGQLTQDRINYLNTLYKLLQPIDEVAQIIFKKDLARMAKYLLPRQPRSTPDEPTDNNTPPVA